MLIMIRDPCIIWIYTIMLPTNSTVNLCILHPWKGQHSWSKHVGVNCVNKPISIYLCAWIKRDQFDVTCFFISLFNAQHVSDDNTSILRCLRLICWVISWVVLLWYDVCWCYVVVCLGWCGIRMQAEAVLQPASWYQITGWSSASACIRIPHNPSQNTK